MDKSALSPVERKLSSDLLKQSQQGQQISTDHNDRFETIDSRIPRGSMIKVQGAYVQAPEDLVYVYIYLNKDASKDAVNSYLWKVANVDAYNKIIVAYVEVARLSALADQKAVRAVRAVMPPEMREKGSTENDLTRRPVLLRDSNAPSHAATRIVGPARNGTEARGVVDASPR